jgi:uncharacterized protein (DUF1330 family)
MESAPADVPVYMVVNLVIQDAAEYRHYEKGFFPLLKRHGGEVLTSDDAPQNLEGSAPRTGRVILSSFPPPPALRAGMTIRIIKPCRPTGAPEPAWNS